MTDSWTYEGLHKQAEQCTACKGVSPIMYFLSASALHAKSLLCVDYSSEMAASSWTCPAEYRLQEQASHSWLTVVHRPSAQHVPEASFLCHRPALASVRYCGGLLINPLTASALAQRQVYLIR